CELTHCPTNAASTSFVILRTSARLTTGCQHTQCGRTGRDRTPVAIRVRHDHPRALPYTRQDYSCPLLPSVSPRLWPVPSRPPVTPSLPPCNSGLFPPCCRVAT